MFSLVSNLLSHRICHVLKLFTEHLNLFLSHLGFLSQILVPVRELVVGRLLLEVFLVKACESLFLGKFFVCDYLTSDLLFI